LKKLFVFSILVSLCGCAYVEQSHLENGIEYSTKGWVLGEGDIEKLKSSFTQTILEDGSSEIVVNQDTDKLYTDITPMMEAIIKIIIDSVVKAAAPSPVP